VFECAMGGKEDLGGGKGDVREGAKKKFGGWIPSGSGAAQVGQGGGKSAELLRRLTWFEQ